MRWIPSYSENILSSCKMALKHILLLHKFKTKDKNIIAPMISNYIVLHILNDIFFSIIEFVYIMLRICYMNIVHKRYNT